MSLLTKRIPTIIGVLLLIIAGVGGYFYYAQNKTTVNELAQPTEVKITNVSDSKFSVSWITKTRMVGQVEWGAVGDKITTVALDDRDTTDKLGEFLVHHITVSELQPDTRYAFRILSGGSNNRFDNNGSPYAVTTGPVITDTPIADSFYGQVESNSGTTPTEAIVYIAVPGGSPLSTLLKSSGVYSVSLSTSRKEDLRSFITYDPAATVVGVTVVDGITKANASVSLTNSAPVPLITMGETMDFRTAVTAPVAQVEPASESATPVTPTVFNVEPLGDIPDPTGEVILLNPEQEGEEIVTNTPEFFGVGPADTVLSITVHSVNPYSDTVIVDQNGEWTWSPPSGLEPGEHTITIAYVDTAGLEQVLSRTFTVSPAMAQEPSFEATPSASTQASSTPTPTPYAYPSPSSSALSETSPTPTTMPTASVRETIPSTESGVPVTGVITPTLLTAVLGFAIMIVGALLIAF